MCKQSEIETKTSKQSETETKTSDPLKYDRLERDEGYDPGHDRNPTPGYGFPLPWRRRGP